MQFIPLRLWLWIIPFVPSFQLLIVRFIVAASTTSNLRVFIFSLIIVIGVLVIFVIFTFRLKVIGLIFPVRCGRDSTSLSFAFRLIFISGSVPPVIFLVISGASCARAIVFIVLFFTALAFKAQLAIIVSEVATEVITSRDAFVPVSLTFIDLFTLLASIFLIARLLAQEVITSICFFITLFSSCVTTSQQVISEQRVRAILGLFLLVRFVFRLQRVILTVFVSFFRFIKTLEL